MLASLGLVGTAVAHDLDHAPPTFSEPAPLSSGVNAGGENAEWELVATVPTGNPQSDLDFFTNKGITYASVGSLIGGANSAGQNIVQLTDAEGEVDPQYVTGHPSASCLTATTAVTGLQHDAEASPKGQALVQFPNPYVVTSDTQIVLDATDGTGRCHDQGTLGVQNAKQGGLEIIDVTDPTAPTEIGMTSHVGQAHTVNVDPKRPHIAYVSSSDFVNYDEEGVRANDEGTSNAMDGIEVVDLSTCMNFPEGATREFKIDACQPVVWRYRWPDVNFARSHTYHAGAACHELEVYPDDRITCAAVDATLLLDVSNAFDDNGTPTDFTDDKPRGTPLPCARRESSTQASAPWHSSAMVTDCTIDQSEPPNSLRVSEWRKLSPPPSLEGVEKLGAAHHMGFENQQEQNAQPAYNSKEDIFVSHEAELTQSGRYVLATDERGGGVLPIGASCSPGADNELGNGGIHAFAVDKLGTPPPEPTGEASPEAEAYQEAVYAKNSEEERAIFRAPTNTEPQGSLCTSHVFQQIPGQNRIFMGWYSQGTQVVDFTENPDGTIDFKHAGYFIPEHANTWTSHIFKVQENQDGTFTYWGATGDFLLGDAGRNAIDIYKVTLPPPPKPRTGETEEVSEPLPGTPTFPISETRGVDNAAEPPACANTSGFEAVGATPRERRRRVRFSFSRRSASGVTVRVIRKSRDRTVIGRTVKTFKNRRKAFTWAARRTANGYYQIRFTTKAPNGTTDTRHLGLRKRNGRWRAIGAFDRRESCDLVNYFRLRSPVFGGKDRRPLPVTFRLSDSAKVSVEVSRAGKVVKRIGERTYGPRSKRTVVIRLGRKAKRGLYTVRLKAVAPGRGTELTLFSRYL